MVRLVFLVEGRVVKTGSTYVNEYAIADHQGNTRVVFSSATPSPVPSTTNMETASGFSNYISIASMEVFDHTDAGTTNVKSQKLTGAPNSMVGVAKSLHVYPGDKVRADADVKDWAPTSNGSDLANFNGWLTSAFGVTAGSTGDALKVFNALNSFGGLVSASVINKRAGGHGLISGRKAFQKPMKDGVQLLNAIQEVYLSNEITIA
jgi:hypothetical protein